jgi:DNA-binding MarR family transcriptional regulator
MQDYTGFSEPQNPQKEKIQGFQSFQKDETPPSPLAKVLLQNVAEHPYMAVSQRYKMLGMKNAQGTEIQQELIAKGFVTPSTVDGKRLLELTESGREALQKLNVKIPKTARGSAEHNYWLEKVKKCFKSVKAYVEKDDIDLIVHDEGSVTAVQIETGKSNLAKNIKTLQDYPADHKFILATNKETEIKLKSLTPSGINTALAKDFTLTR